MKTKILILGILVALATNVAFSQTGTLKIFSESTGTVVYLDEIKQGIDIKIVNAVPAGSHYLKVLDKDSVKIFSDLVTIVENQVTSVLIVSPKTASPVQEKPVVKEEPKTQGLVKTGTINIFSELTGIVVYLNENKQGTDIKQVNAVPVGSHYLKILKDGVSVFGNLVNVTENAVTTVLVQNTGQVQEKILAAKTVEQDEYKNSKLDIILTRGMTTATKGYSTLWPGYYSYWGVSTSVSTSTETTDWKIIQGGVKEIDEGTFAALTNNVELSNSIAAAWKKYNKKITTSGIIGIIAMIPAGIILADILDSKEGSFIKAFNTEKGGNAEAVIGAISLGVSVISVSICLKSPEPRGHFISVDNAAKDSQRYNRELKIKLGLPENYDR